MKKHLKNNRGFTFIELIALVVIFAVVATLAVMSLQAVIRANTTRAAAELSAVLAEARLDAMSRPAGAVELRLYKDGTEGMYCADIVIKESSSSDTKKRITDSKHIASGSLTLAALSGSDNSRAVIDDASEAVIKFSKSDGSLQSFTVGGRGSYDSIEISASDTSVVRIVKKTGRSYVENNQG